MYPFPEFGKKCSYLNLSNSANQTIVNYHASPPKQSLMNIYSPSMLSLLPWCVMASWMRPRRSVWSHPHRFGTLSSHRLCTFISHAGGGIYFVIIKVAIAIARWTSRRTHGKKYTRRKIREKTTIFESPGRHTEKREENKSEKRMTFFWEKSKMENNNW